MAEEKYWKVASGGKMIGDTPWPVKRDELNSDLPSANLLHNSDDCAF